MVSYGLSLCKKLEPRFGREQRKIVRSCKMLASYDLLVKKSFFNVNILCYLTLRFNLKYSIIFPFFALMNYLRGKNVLQTSMQE